MPRRKLTTDMPAYFQKEFRIRSYEVDYSGHARISSILNFLQDLAFHHATALGWGIDALFPKNLTWFLSRSHLQIKKFPSLNEKIIGKTWPSGTRGRFALREYQITDQQENELAAATSSWMLIDLKSKKPVDVDPVVEGINVNRERIIKDNFDPLPALEKVEHQLSFRVRFSDLDANRHVNHVSFIEWTLESVPEEIISTYKPVGIEAVYRREAFYGDRILSNAQSWHGKDPGKKVFIHQLVKERDRKEIAAIRSVWRLS